MNAPMSETIRLIEQLTALALCIQSIELIQLRRVMSDQGIWSWSLLRSEGRSALFELLLRYPNVMLLVALQLLLAVLLLALPHPALNCLLLGTALLICIRFRGTFNGGSDYMTVLLLLVTSIARLLPTAGVQLGCLWYISIQLSASYFIAGIVKLRRSSWREGTALPAIFALPQYRVPRLSQLLADHPGAARLLSWGVLLFEVAFPLALSGPLSCACFLGLAFLFHLSNACILGLNRFLWIWPAAYPALFLCSSL